MHREFSRAGLLACYNFIVDHSTCIPAMGVPYIMVNDAFSLILDYKPHEHGAVYVLYGIARCVSMNRIGIKTYAEKMGLDPEDDETDRKRYSDRLVAKGAINNIELLDLFKSDVKKLFNKYFIILN